MKEKILTLREKLMLVALFIIAMMLWACMGCGVLTRQTVWLPYTRPERTADGGWEIVEDMMDAGEYYNSISHDVGVDTTISIDGQKITYHQEWHTKRDSGGFWAGMVDSITKVIGAVSNKL